MHGAEHEVTYRHTRAGLAADGVRVAHADADRVVLDVDGVRRTFEVARYADGQVDVRTSLGGAKLQESVDARHCAASESQESFERHIHLVHRAKPLLLVHGHAFHDEVR